MKTFLRIVLKNNFKLSVEKKNKLVDFARERKLSKNRYKRGERVFCPLHSYTVPLGRNVLEHSVLGRGYLAQETIQCSS